MKNRNGLVPKVTLTLLILAVLATAALAAGPPRVAGERDASLQGIFQPKDKEVDKNLLLLELPQGTLPGPHELEVSFSARGDSFFTERVAFDVEKSERGLAVELLVWNQNRRAEILALGKDPRNNVKVAIKLDGERVRSLPLDRLVTQTEVLKKVGFAPVVTRLVRDSNEIDLERIVAKTQAECLDACYEEYQVCLQNCDYGCYIDDICETQYSDCQGRCPPDCTGPTTRDYSVAYLVAYSYIGTECRESYWNWSNGGLYYDRYVLQYRVENRRETRYCDGTKTDQLVSYYYAYTHCWNESWPPTSCYPYFSRPSSLC